MYMYYYYCALGQWCFLVVPPKQVPRYNSRNYPNILLLQSYQPNIFHQFKCGLLGKEINLPPVAKKEAKSKGTAYDITKDGCVKCLSCRSGSFINLINQKNIGLLACYMFVLIA